MDRHDQRGRTRVRAQAQVGAEDIAVGRGLRHQLHEQAGAANEVTPDLIVVGQGRSVAVVQQDEVDVARVVEFSRPKLAHAEHGEGGSRRIRADGELSVAGELQKDGIGERVETARGEFAEGARDLFERPDLGDVGDGHGERYAAFQTAQCGGDGGGRRSVAGRHAHRTQVLRQTGENGLRPPPPQIGHKNRVL